MISLQEHCYMTDEQVDEWESKVKAFMNQCLTETPAPLSMTALAEDAAQEFDLYDAD